MNLLERKKRASIENALAQDSVSKTKFLVLVDWFLSQFPLLPKVRNKILDRAMQLSFGYLWQDIGEGTAQGYVSANEATVGSLISQKLSILTLDPSMDNSKLGAFIDTIVKVEIQEHVELALAVLIAFNEHVTAPANMTQYLDLVLALAGYVWNEQTASYQEVE